MIKAEIIADSISPSGARLTTYLLEYPRFVHAEVLTHRVFSKNAASSRAIPVEKMIQQVIDNPAMPVWWGKNQSGMQAREELDDTVANVPTVLDENGESYAKFGRLVSPAIVTAKESVKRQWLNSRNRAIEQVRRFQVLDLHKQIANRILEPWFNIRIILSGTDFENFFALRAHPDAQPEFQALAYKMLEEYNKSSPKNLAVGDWHIPFGDSIDIERLVDVLERIYGFDWDTVEMDRPRWIEDHKIKIAVARCARVSYYNFEGKDDYAKDIETCDKLFGSVPRHLSPAEHVAQALPDNSYSGNFRGWKQYRKIYADENLTDSRVKK